MTLYDKMASSTECVLLFGDSFVGRLDSSLQGRREQLVVNGHSVVLRGYNGAYVADIEQQLKRCSPQGLPMVVLQVGSNDLCKLSRPPNSVADDLMRIAMYLQSNCHVQKVILCEVFRRYSGYRVEGSLDRYNADVDTLNNTLEQRCSANSAIRFWRHGYKFHGQAMYSDGVHLTSPGMKKYRASILHAIILASNA